MPLRPRSLYQRLAPKRKATISKAFSVFRNPVAIPGHLALELVIVRSATAFGALWPLIHQEFVMPRCLWMAALLLFITTARQVVANVVTLDPPGAADSAATGINDAGTISGIYHTSLSGPPLGYVLSGGSYTTIPARAGSIAWPALGINGLGQVVGMVIGNNQQRGYIFDGGFSTLPLPVSGAVAAQAIGINDAGDIVGNYFYLDTTSKGYLLHNGMVTTIDPPGAGAEIAAIGINDAGLIVGDYLGAADSLHHAFLLAGGNYSIIDPPGSFGADATGINSAGRIVGDYFDSHGVFHGFWHSGGVYTTLDVPGSIATQIKGLNDMGQAVGIYRDANGIDHGFLATLPEPAALAPFLMCAWGLVRSPRTATRMQCQW